MADLKRITELGYAQLPICMAKTQLSLSDDPTIVGRPKGFTVTVREVRLSAGAGFLVPLTGEGLFIQGVILAIVAVFFVPAGAAEAGA